MMEKAFLSFIADLLVAEEDVMVSISVILSNKYYPKYSGRPGLIYDIGHP